MIKDAIKKLGTKKNLAAAETRVCFEEIMSGSAAHADIVAFLDGLRKKGETVEEITAAALVMREKSARIDAGPGLLDTCGTGGSGINTFNISTAAAFVAAGCGVKVAKHGNRTASCQCGSADVLESLGVKIDAPIEVMERAIKEIGVGFLFAPVFHSAMKHAVAARKELGGKTIFNILGPLSNPANAAYQIVGVYGEHLTETVAGVMKNLGLKHGFVVHGTDGLDEVTISGGTMVAELENGKIRSYNLMPEDFGVKRGSLAELKGGDAKKNAALIEAVLKGESSARRDVVLVNASLALMACGKAPDILSGMKLAADSIDSGAAREKLKKLVEITKR